MPEWVPGRILREALVPDTPLVSDVAQATMARRVLGLGLGLEAVASEMPLTSGVTSTGPATVFELMGRANSEPIPDELGVTS